MSKEIYIVEKDDYPRLDVFLAEETDYTRSYIKQLNEKGRILLNGKNVKCGKSVKEGDKIEVETVQETLDILPENLPLEILYEDDCIAVIDKAQGMTVHPSAGHYTKTLVNALLYHMKDLSTINGVVRPGIVHRLDKNTSGVMVVAKNDAAHVSLSKQIADRTVTKIYWAITEGHLNQTEGKIETLIARDKIDRKKMAVSNQGRKAITFYKVLRQFNQNSLVEFNIQTGRTHQIRVHAKYLGNPIVGDDVYGFKKQRFNLNGQLLHARSLTFMHPKSGKEMTFTAPLPKHFEHILTLLENELEQ